MWLPAAAGIAAACSSDLGAPPDVQPDLRADSNRDGEIRFDDSDKSKTEWNKATGAVMLANIDDDTLRCRATLDDLTIAECNDASDEVVNGEDDALDIARLKTRPWPKPPEDAVGAVTVEPPSAQDYVRLFWKSGPAPADFLPVQSDTIFTREEIQAGIELGIEAKDIVRDPRRWDGYVSVRFTVTSARAGAASDAVRMRVAPVITYHHLLPVETVWVSNTKRPGNAALRRDLSGACSGTDLGAPQAIDVTDPWTQDFFEPAFMSMPGPSGTQHVMRVNYRSPNVFERLQEKRPLRPAGQFVFKMRGRDVAGIQQYDIGHDERMDSLNSFGNLETIPPHERDGEVFPFGRVVRGRTSSFFPDRSFAAMLDAQRQQPPIDVDTSWLIVGHVDETMSFVKANTPRGWKLLINDARMARKMLEEQVARGHGDVPMFVGKSWFDVRTRAEKPAEVTLQSVLADTEVMRASAEAAVEVDAQLATLRKELGLADDEIIRVPFLHTAYGGKSAAYQPATVNGVYLAEGHFAAPDPHGPVIDGKDIFRAALSEPLANIGVTVHFVEDWDEYHVNLGEVHCGTNTTRRVPDAKWWESGR